MKTRSVLNPLMIAILIGLTILGGAISYWIWRDVEEKRYTDLESTISILNRYYELELLQRELALVSAGKRMLEVEGPNADERRLEIGLDALELYDEFLAFGLTNPDGSMMTFTGNTQSTAVPNLMNSPLTRRSFIHARSQKRISIGEPYYFEQVNDWILPVRTPLFENDSLVAINTSAIQYKGINEDLANFGFNDRYKIHVINTTFNTSQIYYPLELSQYDSILGKDASIYGSFKVFNESGAMTRFEGLNTYEDYEVLGVKIDSKQFERSFIVFVNASILKQAFFQQLRLVIVAYFILAAIVFSGIMYLKRKQQLMQDQILTEKANLESIFESTNSIIGMFDRNKKLLEYNLSFKEDVKEKDGVDLRTGHDFISTVKNRELAKVMEESMDRALAGEKFSVMVDFPGGKQYSQLSYNPIYKKGKITGVSMFVVDVSELRNSQKELEKYSKKLEQLVDDRTKELKKANTKLQKTNTNLQEALDNLKEAQTQLIQAEKMASLGILAAGVGHEINNPLNFIQGGLKALKELLEEESIEGTDINTYLNVIEEGVRRCSAITESLSNYSRQAGQMDEKCDVKSIIDNCLVILNNRMKRKIKIEKDFDQTMHVVMGNEGKLHQVFLNILTNAEQAIPDTGHIWISYKAGKKNATIKIKDDGTGIKKSDLNKIGDPFFTTKAPGEGTGLGLSIAFSIIEEHNGTIKCHSKYNEGTEFVIKLPIVV